MLQLGLDDVGLLTNAASIVKNPKSALSSLVAGETSRGEAKDRRERRSQRKTAPRSERPMDLASEEEEPPGSPCSDAL